VRQDKARQANRQRKAGRQNAGQGRQAQLNCRKVKEGRAQVRQGRAREAGQGKAGQGIKLRLGKAGSLTQADRARKGGSLRQVKSGRHGKAGPGTEGKTGKQRRQEGAREAGRQGKAGRQE
jgi:hypothetical protein